MIEKKFRHIIIFFLLLLIINHYNLFKNTTDIITLTYKERLIKSYGFCTKEGFGYIEYLKKNYKDVHNIKIVNYSSIEPSLWMIFKPILSKYSDSAKHGELILINYPGKYIKNFAINKNNTFIINKNIRNSNAIIEIEFFLHNQNLKSLNVEIEVKNIYNNNNPNNKTIHINNIQKKTLKKKIFYPFESLVHDNIYINFRDENNNLVNNQIKNLLITFQNKILLENYKIIDNYNSCFYLKK
jgi:hypothetical protein